MKKTGTTQSKNTFLEASDPLRSEPHCEPSVGNSLRNATQRKVVG